MSPSLIALITLLAFTAWAEAADSPVQVTNASSATPQEVRCAECHTCPNPTKQDPCLAPCPRLLSANGPEVVLLDQLSAQYVPVIFAHKLHSQMAQMSGGCSLCHHYNPVHRILPCHDCHGESNHEDLAKPGLRGAYHRLCLKCHREWSHETECVVCHAKKTANSGVVVAPDPTDIMGILHPNVEEPVTKIYHTTYERGRLVTFRHREHVERFGFKCVSCHNEESCGRCHQPANATVRTRTLKEHHAPCSSCHQTNGGKTTRCAHCHSDKEIPAFSHEQTGVALNEDHEIATCFDCHVGGKFDQKPSCSGCHDSDVTYPAKLPGIKVKTP